MVKCANCGTGWTSAGLPLCPVCGTKVEASPPTPPLLDLSPVSPRPNGSALLEVPVLKEVAPMNEAPVETRKPETRLLSPLQIPDPSAVLPALKPLPAPSRPLNGPLILGILAYAGVILLPLAVVFESHRVAGVLGFCSAGFFAPFAPIAWMVALSAEKRRRDQGLRPEGRVTLGRLLGQGATLLLVTELTAAMIGIAALRLSGKFPVSFWTGIF